MEKLFFILFCFRKDGRTGTFVVGNDHFPASLLDLSSVVESYKTYDDSALVKTADVSQMIMVRESGEASPDVVENRHGLTPPMRDTRRRRFRKEPDLNPELVQRVEKDLVNIMSGGTVENLDILYTSNFINGQAGDENARNANKKAPAAPAAKPEVPGPGVNAGEPDRTDSDDSDDSM
ncbi:hypothetical protein CRYUN_Cryun02cG0127400 [Craigia yunnanensis]